MNIRASIFASLTLLASTAPVFGWDYEGHRAVNQLALASLPKEFPNFVLSPEASERIAFLSGEPDRWRNVNDPILKHINPPDHFMDMEEATDAGLDLNGISEFRYTFTVQLAAGRAAHANNFPRIDPEKNKDQTRQLIGFLPWTISEYFTKLKSEFSYLKAFEQAGTPEEIANARANIIYVMGVMGHYVGDAAQPLHTTKHYNGWSGANPNGYTTARTFHAWIDSGFFNATGGIYAKSLVTRLKPASILSQPATDTGRSPLFSAVLSYVEAQQVKVEPLYQMEKAGKLDASKAQSAEGRTFLEDQVLIAGNMLGTLWLTAWKEAPVDTYLLEQLARRKNATTP
jgi:hypothetical protein